MTNNFQKFGTQKKPLNLFSETKPINKSSTYTISFYDTRYAPYITHLCFDQYETMLQSGKISIISTLNNC